MDIAIAINTLLHRLDAGREGVNLLGVVLDINGHRIEVDTAGRVLERDLGQRVLETVQKRLMPAWEAGAPDTPANIIDIVADLVQMVGGQPRSRRERTAELAAQPIVEILADRAKHGEQYVAVLTNESEGNRFVYRVSPGKTIIEVRLDDEGEVESITMDNTRS